MQKEIVFIDMDNVLVDFKSGLNKVNEDILSQYSGDGTDEHKPHYDDIPGLFSLMDPMPGAIEAVKTLATRYDLYILSTAPWDNPSAWSDKVEWVKRYFDSDSKDGVFYKRLILTHRKDLCCKDGAFLIDDRPRHGAKNFADHWLSFGEDGKYKSWKEVLDFLMTRP